jgi:hypothetical protein
MLSWIYNLGILQVNPQILTVEYEQEEDDIVSLLILPSRWFLWTYFYGKAQLKMKIFICYSNIVIIFLLTNFLLFISFKIKRGNRPWRPIGLWDVEAPKFSRQSTQRWRKDCQPYASVVLYHPGSFPVLISVRGRVNPRVIVRLSALGNLKNPITSLRIEHLESGL